MSPATLDRPKGTVWIYGRIAVFALGLCIVLAACDSGGGTQAEDAAGDTGATGGDTTTGADTAQSDVASDVAPGEWTLTADPVPAGGFGITNAVLTDDLVTFTVEVDAAADTFGVAFRVGWDPAAFAWVSAGASPSLGDTSTGIARFEVRGDRLVGVVSSIADAPALALDGRRGLVDVTLRRVDSDVGGRIEVLPWHSGTVDPDGVPHRDLPVGGALLAR